MATRMQLNQELSGQHLRLRLSREPQLPSGITEHPGQRPLHCPGHAARTRPLVWSRAGEGTIQAVQQPGDAIPVQHGEVWIVQGVQPPP